MPTLVRLRRFACVGLLSVAVVGALSCDRGREQRLAAAENVLLDGQSSLSTAEGRAQLEKAAELFREEGSAERQAEALHWLAIAEKKAGNFDAALAANRRALATGARQAEFFDPLGALVLIGEIELAKGRPEAAKESYEAARARAVSERHRWYERNALLGLAQCNAALDEPEQAREQFAQAISASEGNLWGVASVLADWGAFEAERRDPEAARRHWARGVRLHREALAQLEADPEARDRRMHLERSRLGAAQISLASAKLEVAEQSRAAALRAVREGLALMADMPLEPEPSVDGRTWAVGANQNRALVAELERLQASLAASESQAGAAPPFPATDEQRAAIRVVEEGKVVVRASLAAAIRRDPSLLSRSARIVPEVDHGKPIGWRLFAVRPDTL
jgi:tetratricopeptide (TPR) repeat protein